MPSTSIRFTVNDKMKGQAVQVAVYDIKGNLVKQVFNGQAAKSQTALWNGTDSRNLRVSSGIYVYRITVGNATQEGQLVLAR
jgi:hypothetical protein